MENALCEVLKDVRIGKILIQTNLDTGEPEVFCCVKQSWILTEIDMAYLYQ